MPAKNFQIGAIKKRFEPGQRLALGNIEVGISTALGRLAVDCHGQCFVADELIMP